MARRISAGVVGGTSVAGLQISTTTITAPENQDIVIDASGTGVFKIASDAILDNQADLLFREATANGTNYVGFQAPASLSGDVLWTLPNSDGTNGQALVTNGSGTLSFATTGATITDNTSDSGTNYLILGTNTSGSLTAVRTSSTGLTFQPSTGTLTVSAAVVNGTVNSLRTENVKTSSHTLALADRDKVVAMNNTTTATVTVPPDSTTNFPVGSVIYIARVNTGSVTLAAGAGVSVSRTGDFATNEELYVRKRAANTWSVVDQPRTPSATGGSIGTAGSDTTSTYTTVGGFTFIIS